MYGFDTFGFYNVTAYDQIQCWPGDASEAWLLSALLPQLAAGEHRTPRTLPPNGLSSPVNGLPTDSPQGQVRPQRGQRYLSPAAPRDGAASLRSPVRCPAAL